MASLSAFTIPVLLNTNAHDPSHTTRQWALLYQYGRQYMPVLCIATCGLYGSAILNHKHQVSKSMYMLALGLTIGMVPFTWLAMAGTNGVLFGIEEMVREGEGMVSSMRGVGCLMT